MSDIGNPRGTGNDLGGDMRLSEKEQKLLDYIATRKENITSELIKVELGEEYLGAIGKLIQYELIYSEKKKLDVDSTFNKYGFKYTKCYMIKKEK